LYAQGSTNENLAPAAINSLTKELANLCKEPEEGITVILNEENVADIVAEIDGPGTATHLKDTRVVRSTGVPHTGQCDADQGRRRRYSFIKDDSPPSILRAVSHTPHSHTRCRLVRGTHSSPCLFCSLPCPHSDAREGAGFRRGAEGTPYAGGAFRMKLVLPGDFPNSAPKGELSRNKKTFSFSPQNPQTHT